MANAQDLGDAVALMLESLALSEATMRCTLIWAGLELPCVGGPELGGKHIDEGGMRVSCQVKIKIRNEVFPLGVGFPEEGQTILYKRSAGSEPRKLRVIAKTNYFDAFMQLECNDPNQGA